MKNAHAPFESLGIKDLVPPIAAHPEAPLSSLLPQARSALTYALASAEQDAPLRVFFSICDGKTRARVVHVDGPDSETIWCRFDEWRSAWPEPDPQVRWLRIDWVTRTWNLTWEQCQLAIRSSKRNYFRYGIALDPDFRQAFLEQELNANAMLYLGNDRHEGGLNAKNTQIYGQRRFGRGFHLPEAPTDPVRLFATDAFLLQPDRPPVPLHGFSGGTEGRDTGRRQVDPLDAATVENMVDQSSRFLAAQVDPEGQFVYGVHPCFDREIKSYNTLRHASTVYAMLEAWQVTRDAGLKAAIDRALRLLTEGLIRQYTVPGGERVAYLLDVNNEVKLGGSAVCLLALVTYTELTGDERHLPLLEQLAQGIALMQDPDSGQLSHVLHAEDLSVKERFRIIYYDGEAAFGLMRLYGLTKDPRWLALVEKAFDYFIAQEHWRTNDHWLGYCVNELTLYRPEERYFRFGLQNVATHLDFVIDRITTFPTLLELMMAAHKMILRLEQSEAHRHLLKHLDRDKFYRALETRARYMLNGFFWPETAMYFRNPRRILGSFFIRHHAFRVRIDDVEHYLSGFVAYLRHYLHREVAPTLPSPAPAPARDLPRPADAVLACGGAVNLGRRQHMRTAQLGAQNVLDIPELRAADLAVVNLDCVVSTLGRQGTDKGEAGPFYCRARPELLRVLTAAGVDAVTVANAHSGDYGPTALQQQHEILDALGIASTGSGADRQDAFDPAVCRASDMRVALLSVDTTQHRFAAGDDGFGTAYLSPTDPRAWRRVMAERIAAARNEADIVLVSVHWAARSTPTRDSDIRTLSHALVDVGADGVLGTTGPHLHGIELYHGETDHPRHRLPAVGHPARVVPTRRAIPPGPVQDRDHLGRIRARWYRRRLQPASRRRSGNSGNRQLRWRLSGAGYNAHPHRGTGLRPARPLGTAFRQHRCTSHQALRPLPSRPPGPLHARFRLGTGRLRSRRCPHRTGDAERASAAGNEGKTPSNHRPPDALDRNLVVKPETCRRRSSAQRSRHSAWITARGRMGQRDRPRSLRLDAAHHPLAAWSDLL